MAKPAPTGFQRDLAFWSGPFRAIHTNIRKSDATLDADRLLDWAAEAGANMVMCGGGGIVCFYPTALPYQRVAEQLPPGRDLLGEIVEGAHRRGMRALARMDVGKHYRSLYESHPDWFAHDRADQPLRVSDGELYVTCPNGEYRQRCTFEIMGEILDRYPVDGFFYNGFAYLDCECATCRRAFESATGLPYPASPHTNWETWQALGAYRSGIVTALAAQIRNFLHARDPQLMSSIDFHLTADRPGRQRERGFDILGLAGAVDVITVEAHVTLNRPQPLWPYWAGEECLLARTFAENQPITILLSYFDLQGSRRSGQPPGQLAYDVLQIAACGGQPWIAFSGTVEEQDDRRALPAVQETYRFLARHEAYYRDLRSAAEVAVVYSRSSFEWVEFHESGLGTARPARQWVEEYRGCYAALVEDHIPFDVLCHEHIGPRARWTAARLAERRRVLVLPNVLCLSDEDATTLDEYVALGGRLLCTGDTGLRDRSGKARAGAALRSLGVVPVRRREVRGAYLRVRDAAAAGLPRLGDVGLLPLDGPFVYTAPVQANPTDREPVEDTAARRPLTFIPPVVNNIPEFAFWPADDETDAPGLIHTRAGKGIAAWLPWPAGESYWLLRHAPFGYLLGDLVHDLLGRSQIETDAPASVQMTLHDQPRSGRGGGANRRVLHLLNGTGHESRALEQVIPLGSIRVQVDAPGATAARSLVLEQDLPCEVAENGRLAFTLPRLSAYDVIVLE